MTSSNTIPVTETPKTGSRLRKVLIVLIPILILVGFIAATQVIIAMNQEEEEKRRPFNTLAVMADYAVSDSVTLDVRAQGEARPRTEIDLVPEVGGKIVYVSPNFVEGGIFRRGETLLRVDPSDSEVGVIRARAGLAQARQALVREQAEANIARADIDDLGIEGASDLALRLPQLQQAEASVQASEAELAAAELQLKRTSVVAPFSGRVREKTSDVGQFVSPGARLGRIFSTDIVEVRLPLTDLDLGKLELPIAYVADSRETAPVVALSATIGGKLQSWDGRLMRTDPAYDRQTRALFAIVEVFDPYGDGASQNGVPLAPGLFVDAVVQGREIENVIVLPRDGLRPQDQVFVVDDQGKAEIRNVTVIESTAERAVLSSGISAGELVVLSPLEKSRMETPLKVIDIKDSKTVLVDPPRPDWAGDGADRPKRDGDDADDMDGNDTDDDDTASGSSAASEGASQ